MIRLPNYKPDADEVQRLEDRAWGLGYPLIGCQTIYTLQFIALFLEAEQEEKKDAAKLKGPTAGDISWGLHEPQQYVNDRLREMTKRGLVVCTSDWEPDPYDPNDRFGKPVPRYTLSEEGQTVITPRFEASAIGVRSRASALAAG